MRDVAVNPVNIDIKAGRLMTLPPAVTRNTATNAKTAGAMTS